LARDVLSKKQSEHHLVARKMLIQHKHDFDLLALMKAKVDAMLSKAKVEAEHVYRGNHGYNPVKTEPSPAPAPAPAKAEKAVKAADSKSDAAAAFIELSSDTETESESEQQIMVDESGLPVLPMSPPTDLNAPLDPPTSAADAIDLPAKPSAADMAEAPTTAPPRFAEVDESESSDEEFGSVMPVEQVELPTPRFAEAEADADVDAEDAEDAESDAESDEAFTPEMSADSKLDALPVEAELI